MSADFTPEKEDYKILTPFKMQVLTNFPYIEADFDALTNYQLLCKIVEYLNNVIHNENEVTEQVEGLYNAYVSLQNYVNDYFENLDVQDEINIKLDQMAEDGTLSNLINPYLDTMLNQQQQNINNLSSSVSTLSSRMDNFETLAEGSTTGDAELIDIRTDYQGITWTNAGTSVRNQSKQSSDRITKSTSGTASLSLIQPDTIESGKWWNISTKSWNTGSNASTSIFTVTEDTEYHVQTRVDSTTSAIAVFFDSSNNQIGYFNNTTGVYDDAIVITPKGCTKMYVGSYYSYAHKVWETIINTYNDIKKLKHQTFDNGTKQNIEADTYIHNSYYNAVSHEQTSFNNYDTNIYEYDNTKDYFLTASIQGTGNALVVFLDENNNYLDRFPNSLSNTRRDYSEYLIENIPNGTHYLVCSFLSNRTYAMQTYNSANVSMLPYMEASYYDRLYDEQTKNPFAWKTYDKGQVTFTFDDSLNDIDLVADIFAEYHIPCCMSTIPSRLQNTTTATGDNETVKEVLTRIQNAGGEILNHGGTAMSSESTDEQIYNLFVNNRKTLVDNGFEVNGIIEVGSGGGELTFDYKRCEKYLRQFYRYSDDYGRNLDLPQFQCHRTYISSNINNNHNAINNCKTNKTWLIFATHSVNNAEPTSTSTTEAILRDTIEYAIAQGLDIVTMKTHYNTYKSSVLENAIL